jgi:hypothetical protein
MDIPEQLTTTLTVEKLGAANAERGTQMINVFIPEIGIAKYSTTMFVPMEVSANLKADDVFTATISRGKLKNNKDGEWANEYYWDYGTREDDSDWRVEPPARPPAAPAAPRPTEDDRQSKIMLQHASSVVGPAYGDWSRLEYATRGTFSDYLKAIAMGATWYLKHVYMTTGYNPQPAPVDEVEQNDPWDQAVDA